LNTFCKEKTATLHRRNGKKVEAAFEAVVDKYKEKAYFIALGLVGNRDDALELSQEAFFRAYLNIDKLRSSSKFFPWFYQILRNLCFSHLRKVKGKRMFSLDETGNQNPGSVASVRFDPEMVAQRNEEKDRLWEAIGQLGDRHREVIVLRHFQELSYEQIAQALFCTKGTVMSRLYYARKNLKEILDSEKGGQ